MIYRRRYFNPSQKLRLFLALLVLLQLCLGTSFSPLKAATSNSLTLNGTSSYVQVPDSASLRIPINLTVEAWLKPVAVSGTSYPVSKTGYRLSVAPLSSGFQVAFELSIGGSWQSFASGQLALGQWYHVAGSYDGSYARLFVNGTRVKNIVTSGNVDQSSAALTIGTAQASGDFFNGNIDEVRVSSIVRYTGNFIIPTAPFSSDINTKGLWHFDEGSGTTTADVSGNNNNGSLLGGPVWSTDTPFTVDTTPPVISGINVTNLTTTSATITWNTDKPATSQVNFGTTTAYGSSTPLDSALVTAHSQTISGLSANTLYNFQVISKSGSGAQSTSTNATFTTLVTNPPSAPVISQLGFGNVTTSSVTLSWVTDVPADSQVEYGTSSAYGSSTTLDAAPVTVHNVTITGLSATLTYHYRVKSRGANGLLTTSGDNVFLTADVSSATQGQWSPVLSWPLVAVHMAMLPDGKVLVWDAWETNVTTSARLWDPVSQAFSGVSNQFSSIFCSGQAMLADGRQLVVGGFVAADYGIKDTNIFNPVTDSWTRVADMAYPRWYPTAVTLSDGKVLVLGGEATPGTYSDIPEVYNPATNSWTGWATARLNVGEYPPTYTLPNGKVFMLSGADDKTRTLDLGTQSWTVVGTSAITAAATAMYRPGKIIATGGNQTSDKLTAVIDMNQPNPAWRLTSPMANNRFQQNLVVLPDGKVMVVGGADIYSLTSTTGPLATEMWDPNTETWTTMASLSNRRMYHSTVMLLPDGRLLAAGGGRVAPAIDYLTAELYSPPYLFKGPRPSIASAPGSVNYGANINVQTPDAASIASVSFVRLSSVTHTLNTDQRFINLNFSQTANGLTIQAPADANLAPPGDYMLFLVNANGVPSVAKIMQIGPSGVVDTQAPTVSLTAPANGATVSGSAVTVSANASDNVGVSNVQFTLDGNPLGSPVASAPYNLSWNTTTIANGSHTLGAQARDAAGNVGTATSVSVTVSNVTPPSPPVISAVTAGNIQSSTVTISWTTDKPASSQVDYGLTTAYGNSTNIDNTLVTSHSVALTGLNPSSTYHYRVRSTDAGGNSAVSGDFSFTTTAAAPTILLGSQTVGANQDNNPAGTAEAFVYIASASGSINKVAVYIDGNNTASSVLVGVYQSTRDNKPGTLLAQATITNPTKGAWNTVSLPIPPNVTAGGAYWIAILGPVGAGTVQFRDVATGTTAYVSAQTNLTTLPATWTVGSMYANSPLSAYAIQDVAAPADTTPPVVAMASPANGATVSGSAVNITATASDNVGVTGVQFLLDGNPLGSPTSLAPYSYTWDTTAAGNGSHTLSARASDAAGNSGTAANITVTVSNAPPAPPVISNVAAGNLQTSAATITWTTDKPANSQVNYGLTTAYGSNSSLDTTLVTSHSVTLAGLSSNTTYHYQVRSVDAGGNPAVSGDFSFTTAAPSPPVISNVSTTNIQSTSVTFNWTTNNPASSQVDYGLTAAYGSSTILDNTPVTSHSQGLSGLTPGTLYHYRVRSVDTNGLTAVSGDFTFTTAAPSPPVISNVAATNFSPTSTTITWTTDKPASSQVDYGATTAYGSSSTLDSTLVTNHSVVLSGLTPSTVYHYRVRSVDANSLATVSGDFVFTSASATPVMLVGDLNIETNQDDNPAGKAEAFQYTATTGGIATKLYVYIDSPNTATSVVVGIYTDNANNPGTLLAQATITNPVKGAWNSVTIPAASVTAGTKYWIAILGAAGTGTVKFRDTATGGRAQTSSQANLATLPATWTTGASYNNSPMSAYLMTN